MDSLPTLQERITAKIADEDTGILKKTSICDICAPGPHCGITCYVKDGKIIKVEGTDGHPVNNGRLCSRGQCTRQYVYRDDRLLTPLKRVGPRGSGEFEPISWDEAYQTIADRLGEIRTAYGASATAFYSGYNKWYRPLLQRFCYSYGSVNYGTESSSCFTSTAMSWRLATGAEVANPDLRNAGVFLAWSYNSFYSMHVAIHGLIAGRKRGMKVIVIDPRITTAAEQYSDMHLRPRPGTDGALALSFARELIVNDWVDHDYIRNHVYGYEPYRDYVMDFTPERAEKITGVPAGQIREAVRLIHENMPLAINQAAASMVHHTNGMQSHRAIMSLYALTGGYDRPGGCVPGSLHFAFNQEGYQINEHSFMHDTYPKNAPLPVGAERFPLWNELLGEMQANDLARQILVGKPYPIKAVYAHGMNFRMFNGDRHLREALLSLDFFVDIDLFMTDTAKLADIVLPCCTSVERSECKVYPSGFLHYTEPVIEPLGESRPDDRIICDLAKLLSPQDKLLCAGPEACLRFLLKDFKINLDAVKADSQHLHRPEGFSIVPLGQHDFATPTGKFELWSTVLEKYPQFEALPKWYPSLDCSDSEVFPMTLVTGARLPHALHSRLHKVAWLRAMRPEVMADISLEDAEANGISNGDLINLATSEGTLTVKANPTARVPKGTVFLYHGYSEADANSIVPYGHNDPYSGFPGYRSIRCSIRKEAEI